MEGCLLVKSPDYSRLDNDWVRLKLQICKEWLTVPLGKVSKAKGCIGMVHFLMLTSIMVVKGY